MPFFTENDHQSLLDIIRAENEEVKRTEKIVEVATNYSQMLNEYDELRKKNDELIKKNDEYRQKNDELFRAATAFARDKSERKNTFKTVEEKEEVYEDEEKRPFLEDMFDSRGNLIPRKRK